MSAINAVAKGAAAVGAHLVRDVSLPALVLHRDALEHNIRWMQAFVSNSGAELAPHILDLERERRLLLGPDIQDECLRRAKGFTMAAADAAVGDLVFHVRQGTVLGR